MKIVIKKLTLTNFKGIKSFEVTFNHITNIFGENASGKTTLMDAFLWLFFGKDSTDRKDFELKPLDVNGKSIEKVDVEVSASIEVEGKPVEIKKILREKWVKKRGELTPEFAGNENLYYWNEVPLQLKQFQDKITDMLPEHLFKLITNPLYFNSLKWQDRRSELLGLAGSISNADLVAANPDFQSLLTILADKSLEDYKREISVKKKKLKDDLQAIPTRIDEANRSMPEPQDFDAIRSLIDENTNLLDGIDRTLQSASKALQAKHTSLREKQTELHELKTKVLNIKNEVRSHFLESHNDRKNKIQNLDRLVDNVTRDINDLNAQINNAERAKQVAEEERTVLRTKWDKVSAEKLEFDEAGFACPSCKRALEENDITAKKKELAENFNTDKSTRLKEIADKGGYAKTKVEGLEKQITEWKSNVINMEQQLQKYNEDLAAARQEHDKITTNAEQEYNNTLAANADYKNVNASITSLEKELAQPITEEDNSELQQQKSEINIKLDSLKKQLADEDRIVQGKKRIDQLQEEEGKLAQQLADLEGSEYLAEQFTRAKMDTLVQRINGRFKYVTFKLFDTQINGGEVECCDTMVSGVPFSDANNAAKINAGLDIINTLCEHYGVYAPIFIDNRESVNNLIDCNSQVVNLIVSTDKKLRVA